MKKILCIFMVLSSIFSLNANAWEREFSIGYGYGKEIGQSYYNYGITASGKFFKHRLDPGLILTFDPTLSYWRSQTANHNILASVAIAAALRGYFVNPDCYCYRPYIGASMGPAYLSSRYFGTRVQGSKFAFQITFEGGVEIKNIDISLHLAHYCNAGITRPNQAINIPFVLSFGYLF